MCIRDFLLPGMISRLKISCVFETFSSLAWFPGSWFHVYSSLSPICHDFQAHDFMCIESFYNLSWFPNPGFHACPSLSPPCHDSQAQDFMCIRDFLQSVMISRLRISCVFESFYNLSWFLRLTFHVYLEISSTCHDSEL